MYINWDPNFLWDPEDMTWVSQKLFISVSSGMPPLLPLSNCSCLAVFHLGGLLSDECRTAIPPFLHRLRLFLHTGTHVSSPKGNISSNPQAPSSSTVTKVSLDSMT